MGPKNKAKKSYPHYLELFFRMPLTVEHSFMIMDKYIFFALLDVTIEWRNMRIHFIKLK